MLYKYRNNERRLIGDDASIITHIQRSTCCYNINMAETNAVTLKTASFRHQVLYISCLIVYADHAIHTRTFITLSSTSSLANMHIYPERTQPISFI